MTVLNSFPTSFPPPPPKKKKRQQSQSARQQGSQHELKDSSKMQALLLKRETVEGKRHRLKGSCDGNPLAALELYDGRELPFGSAPACKQQGSVGRGSVGLPGSALPYPAVSALHHPANQHIRLTEKKINQTCNIGLAWRKSQGTLTVPREPGGTKPNRSHRGDNKNWTGDRLYHRLGECTCCVRDNIQCFGHIIRRSQCLKQGKCCAFSSNNTTGIKLYNHFHHNANKHTCTCLHPNTLHVP